LTTEISRRDVAAAQRGDAVALERVLEAFRPYLLTIANRDLPADLWGKCGGSDLVQETMLEAHRGFAGFGGREPDELRRWLRGILRHNLKDAIRRFAVTRCRSTGRERSLHSDSESAQRARGLVDPEPTPCTLATDRDETRALDAALARLPDDERDVIILRNREHLPWDEVGRRLNRSGDAARMLWNRALFRLQPMLDPDRPESGRV
jgi:RNA polymerase sigma-70 factor, ECF subfamily